MADGEQKIDTAQAQDSAQEELDLPPPQGTSQSGSPLPRPFSFGAQQPNSLSSEGQPPSGLPSPGQPPDRSFPESSFPESEWPEHELPDSFPTDGEPPQAQSTATTRPQSENTAPDQQTAEIVEQPLPTGTELSTDEIVFFALISAFVLAILIAVVRLGQLFRRYGGNLSGPGTVEVEFSPASQDEALTMKLSEKGAPTRSTGANAAPPNRDRSSIAERMVSDRPLRPGDPDPLNYGGIAKSISAFLRNEQTQPPLTLAVLGEWGTGKSSVMALLKADLEKHAYRPVWFNAWHHQKEEHLLAALLEAIRNEAMPPFFSAEGLEVRRRLLLRRSRERPVATAGYLAILACILAFAAASILFDAESKIGSLFAESSAAVGTLGIAGLLSVLYGVWQRVKAFVSPTQLTQHLSRLWSVGQASDQLSFRFRFAKEFHDFAEVQKPLRPVIVIDDLDRCQPENVMEVLEAVNFLVSSGDCYVILGMDKHRVEGCVAHLFSDVATELAKEERGEAEAKWDYAQQYLQKLINIEVPLPTLEPHDADRVLQSTATEQPVEETNRENGGLLRWLVGAAAFLGGLVFAVLYALTSAVGPEEGTTGGGAVAGTTGPATAEPQGWLVSLDGWLILAALALLAGSLWILVNSRLVGIKLILKKAVIDDSKEFLEALSFWTNEIVEAHGTPRALKRFLNRLRYLAMCNRGEATTETLSESAIVAYAALEARHGASPLYLFSETGFDCEPAPDHPDMTQPNETGRLIHRHRQEFGDNLQNQDNLARYQRIRSGVRVN